MATEWGGKINPEEYADYLIAFSEKLKEASENFFVLPAGLDASAPNDKKHMSESVFLKRMVAQNKNVFDFVDGWNSHSYPNPNFSGSETETGQGTIKTFEWELEYLKTLGVAKNLPVFITETGWAHDMENGNNGYKNSNLIGDKLTSAFESAWDNKKIVAITPFILNYQGKPFDVFSWKKADGSFYDFYYEIQSMAKTKGEPTRINSIQTITTFLPEIIKSGNRKLGLAYVKNTGQVIWTQSEVQTVEENGKIFEIEPIPFLHSIEPKNKALIFYTLLP